MQVETLEKKESYELNEDKRDSKRGHNVTIQVERERTAISLRRILYLGNFKSVDTSLVGFYCPDIITLVLGELFSTPIAPYSKLLKLFTKPRYITTPMPILFL